MQEQHALNTLRDLLSDHTNKDLLAGHADFEQTIHHLALLLDMQEIERITHTQTCPWCHQDY